MVKSAAIDVDALVLDGLGLSPCSWRDVLEMFPERITNSCDEHESEVKYAAGKLDELRDREDRQSAQEGEDVDDEQENEKKRESLKNLYTELGP